VWRLSVVNGIAQGAVYALIALGYSLVYGILRMINFAHGEVFMAGSFISYFVGRAMESTGFLNRNPVVGLTVMFLVAMLASVSISVLLERVAYRPLRNAPRMVPLITAIGASLFLQNTFRGLFGAQTRGYPQVDALKGTWTILGIPIDRTEVVTIVVAGVAMAALSLFVSRSRTGRSMRAVSEDREIASLMGINVDRTITVTFAIGGALAGIAGVLFSLTFTQVSASMGFVPGIKAFTAAVLGGIGSIVGAALGGLLLGVLEFVGPLLLLKGFHVPSPLQLSDLIAFGILVVVLIFRPTGLLGGKDREKV
jgi:branched-chain amino acid transport system permease protein